MSLEQLGRLEAIFQETCNLPTAEQSAYLDQVCSEDAGLRREVERLLRADQQTGAMDAGGHHRSELERAWDELHNQGSLLDELPEQIGPFQLVGCIGSGSSSMVLEAQQESPKRRVALKLLRFSVDRAALERFRREVHVLGMLQHPGIAQVYQTDTVTLGGRKHPFFVMELVDGLDLIEHANQNGLSTTERIRLVERLCDAIQHAHERGVIHRDLKPANVLVAQDNAFGQPKVLDFGVARSLSDTQQQHTSPGVLVGTLRYMSPEQASGLSATVGTRSDVYSLGLLLHEILAGQLPYDLTGQSVPSMMRIIAGQPPTLLRQHRPELRGDLETIVAKALAKEPKQRYASAGELGEDLRSFRNQRPISARPTSLLYVVSRFAARQKGLVAGVALALLMGVAALVASLFMFDSMRAERNIARAALQESEAVTAFLTEIIYSASPESMPGNPSIRALLDAAAEDLQSNPPVHPGTAARLYDTIGESYRALGEFARAEHFLKLSLETRAPLGDDLAYAATLQNLARLESALGRKHRAADLARRALGIQVARSGDKTDAALVSREILGDAIRGSGQRLAGLEILRSAYADRCALHGASDPRTLRLAGRLAAALSSVENREGAEQLLRQILKHSDRLNVTIVGPATLNLASIAKERNDAQRAHDLLVQNETYLAAHVAPDHNLLQKNTTDLAIIDIELGLYDALERLEQAYQRGGATIGLTHPNTLWQAYSLGRAYLDQGCPEDALRALQPVVQATAWRTPGFIQLLSEAYRQLGDPVTASWLQEQSTAIPVVGGHAWQRTDLDPLPGKRREPLR